ncbi:hypothetical protein [Streptomyces sp. NPDC058953]|uniref:hypothetical protein n=1 Tax=unclassified Streptomyces TaxID=2593676 RepID=UPI0036C6166F
MNLPGFTAGSSVGYGVFPAQVSYGTCSDECRVICRSQCQHKYDPAACSQRCQGPCVDDCMRPPCTPDCHDVTYCDEDGATVAVTKCRECDGTESTSPPRLIKPTCP